MENEGVYLYFSIPLQLLECNLWIQISDPGYLKVLMTVLSYTLFKYIIHTNQITSTVYGWSINYVDFNYYHDCRPEMFHFPKLLSVPFMSLNSLPNSEEKIRFKKYIGLHHFNS